MPSVNIVFGGLDNYNRQRPSPVIRIRTTERIVPSGTNQVSTTAAAGQAVAGGYGEYVSITTDTAVNIAIGASPVATAVADATSVTILANQTRDFAIGPGQRVAVINATL